MKQLPNVTVLIITYNRRAELKQTLKALYNYLYYDGIIRYLIADDCTGGTYRDDVLSDVGAARMSEETKFISTPHNSGWAGNFNHAYSHVTDDFVLLIEDDYIATENIDISPYVALMLAHTGIGLVRLDGIAGHKAVCHVNETDIGDYLPHYRQGASMPGKLNYFLLDNSSRETWLYSNRVHLKHRRFHDFYGMYPEGLRLGHTEESYAHHVKDMMLLENAPAIAVPLDATSYFDHIGKSYQWTEHDKEHRVNER